MKGMKKKERNWEPEMEREGDNGGVLEILKFFTIFCGVLKKVVGVKSITLHMRHNLLVKGPLGLYQSRPLWRGRFVGL